MISMTNEEWEMTLGRQLSDLRLLQNINQLRLAGEALLNSIWKG
jgi:hypothetical protein